MVPVHEHEYEHEYKQGSGNRVYCDCGLEFESGKDGDPRVIHLHWDDFMKRVMKMEPSAGDSDDGERR